MRGVPSLAVTDTDIAYLAAIPRFPPIDTLIRGNRSACRCHYGGMTDRYGATPLHVVVADNVRLLCSRRRVHQSDLADVLGMSRMAVSDRFRYRTPWTLDEVALLAQAFQVPVSVLLGEAPSTVPVDAETGQATGTLLGLPERDSRLPPSIGQLLPGVPYDRVS
jgi:transcriptional regulator with XRE-family HTH domain